MNDPHVVALIYRVVHDDSVQYERAEPLAYETEDFRLRLERGEARFEPKKHHPTAEGAREVIEGWIRIWEFSADLQRRPGEFGLRYETAELVDRQPDSSNVRYGSVRMSAAAGIAVKGVVGRGSYPSPYSNVALSPVVTVLWDRFTRYQGGKDTLAGFGYFCLTVLERDAGKRAAAADRFRVSSTVLTRLGRLTSGSGGLDARKAEGIHREYSRSERKWLEAVIKVLIRRAAEVAFDPNQALPQITMGDLPDL